VLSAAELSAMDLLIVKYMEVWQANQQDLKTKAEVDARLAGYPAQYQQFFGAFSLFGFHPDKEGWIPVRKAMGEAAYARCLAKFGRVPEATPDHKSNKTEMPLLQSTVAPEDNDAPIRELVLRRLKGSPEGLKASQLREYIEALRKTRLHEKTIGMTLYRLSQDGRARRDGRTWFYVEPAGEAKNPGTVNAGAINRDDEEGEEP
jgi:hypothetical protein